MSNRQRAYNRSSQSIFRVYNKTLCCVCYCYRSFDLFSTVYCCSSLIKHHTRVICDKCVYNHVVTALNSCLVSSVGCPEFTCRSCFSQSTICDILLKYENNDLLNDYLREQPRQGKSIEYIKRFTKPCPGCNVPIEKDGGCDQMICSRCQLYFYWSTAKNSVLNNKKVDQQGYFNSNSIVDYIIFGFILVLCIINVLTYFICI